MITTEVMTSTENEPPKYEKYKFLNWEFETPLIWTNVFFITLWHVLALYLALVHNYRETPGIIIYGCILGGLGGFGVTAGAHRYFTHRSYKATLPLRIFLILCFTLSGQNSILDWVRDHRVHHKFSETDADPHNAKRGFFFAHVGWLMMKKHPEVLRKGKTVDCSDLFEDPLVAFHQKYFSVIKLFVAFIIPTMIPPYLYDETWYNSIVCTCFVRYIATLNFTWSVNSAAHLWGNRPYNTKIYPKENLLVSLIAIGEGYHNYHHTFPWDYRAAELGMKLNFTTFVLNFFKSIGWAYDMKSASEDVVRKMAENWGDGTHLKWGHEVDEKEFRMMEKRR